MYKISKKFNLPLTSSNHVPHNVKEDENIQKNYFHSINTTEKFIFPVNLDENSMKGRKNISSYFIETMKIFSHRVSCLCFHNVYCGKNNKRNCHPQHFFSFKNHKIFWIRGVKINFIHANRIYSFLARILSCLLSWLPQRKNLYFVKWLPYYKFNQKV